MYMQRFISSTLLLVFSLLFDCFKASPVKAQKTLIIATEPLSPPCRRARAELQGFDIDLIICDWPRCLT